MTRQRGGLILGLIIGLLVGLGMALAVALYVTKAPVPFVNKVPPRTADQDAAEVERNRNWDPNAGLGRWKPRRPPPQPVRRQRSCRRRRPRARRRPRRRDAIPHPSWPAVKSSVRLRRPSRPRPRGPRLRPRARRWPRPRQPLLPALHRPSHRVRPPMRSSSLYRLALSSPATKPNSNAPNWPSWALRRN